MSQLEIGHYYFLHPHDAPKYNHSRQPRIMVVQDGALHEVMPWSSQLPIHIPQSKLDELMKIDAEWDARLGQETDWVKWTLNNLRSLHASVVDDGLLVVKHVRASVGTGIVTVFVKSSGVTHYHSLFSDLHLHPEVMRASGNLLVVTLRLVTDKGEWVTEL